ncbi:unnamed protein product [Enterobius vermicularis]|uniref:RING-type domain-containing protein n=1 Tax=Enterobius vermicularis TaxID=51028 RepID=A0A0N4V9K1_ENTVE|nr:unnamed protein product [Enterobius vermicularis]
MRECPKCKTKEYNNRSMVMMINECGHPLCRNCVENLFARNSGPCPQCGRTLYKKGFWEQTFDDPIIERENHVRKKLKKIYNLHREDFPSLREFNDYLEHFETIVMNLANDIDVEETEAEIKKFKEKNSDLIEKNKKKLDEDQLFIQRTLEEERRFKERKERNGYNDDGLAQKSGNVVNAKSIIEELKDSDLPAEVILDRQRKRQIEADLAEKEEAAKRKRKLKLEAQQKKLETATFGPLRVSGAPFIYRPPDLLINGPPLPTWENVSSMGYVQHIRTVSKGRLAAGFTPETGCMRALFESKVDLFAF